MEGVVIFTYGKTSIPIRGCPYDVLIILGENQADVDIEIQGKKIPIYSRTHYSSLYYHLCGKPINYQSYEKIIEWIGFIPFYEYRNGERWYVPEATFKTCEEMEARRKPIQTQMFMGVPNFPVAFIREMATVCELVDVVPDMAGFPEKIDISKLDSGVAVHFTDAMIALLPEHRGIKHMRLEYLVIYDFLGLTRTDMKKTYFINGDRVMERTQLNLAITGQLWNCKNILLFPTFEELGDPHKLINCEYLSDNMIAEYKLWKTVLKIVDNPELSPIQVRVMQYLLRRNGHSFFHVSQKTD